MPLISVLALLLVIGMCFLLFVWAQIIFCALWRFLGQTVTNGTAGGQQHQSPGVDVVFTPGFRTIHFYIFAGFVLVYSLLADLIWGSYYHTFKAILMTICGPFATAILDPTEEHWKTAWALYPFCAAFLVWGGFCQFVRLPFQRNPRRVALVMWALGLMIWFDAAILSYVLAA